MTSPAHFRVIGRLGLLSAVLVGFGTVTWFVFFRTENSTSPTGPSESPTGASLEQPADPRLTYSTHFQNIHPSVKYVGDAACEGCHPNITHSYHQHPMGRSASVFGDQSLLEQYDASAHNPFTTGAYQLSVIRENGRMIHRLSGGSPTTVGLPPADQPIDLIIGSGTRGRSYLTVDHGSVWQTGISWFTDDNRWNVSPGFDLAKGGRRPIPAECLFCHVNRTDPIPGSNNLYKQAIVGQPHIGCERCHGPGERHVQTQTAQVVSAPDYTIVNPKRLPRERQLDICRQCHLLGEQRVERRGRSLFEYRPGLPLELFLNVFVRRPDLVDSQRSVGQFEQMERSACFRKSAEALSCTSCHDPHTAPPAAEKPAFFRSKCMTCHSTRGCSEREPIRTAANDSCVACHMPRRGSTSIAHAPVTDHRILRDPDKPPPPPPATSELTIVPYFASTEVSEEERKRDEGIALFRHLLKLPPTAPSTRSTGLAAASRLQAAVRQFPTDAVAWISMAGIAAQFRQIEIQLEAARKAAEILPDSEAALSARAGAELRAREFQTALRLADRLITLNPASVEYRQLRATALIASRDWVAAEAASREAVGLNPMAAESHILLAMALNGLGKRTEAKKAADMAFALETNPSVQNQYREWLGR